MNGESARRDAASQYSHAAASPFPVPQRLNALRRVNLAQRVNSDFRSDNTGSNPVGVATYAARTYGRSATRMARRCTTWLSKRGALMVRVVVYPRKLVWYGRWWDRLDRKIRAKSLGTSDYVEAKRKAAELAQDIEQGLPTKAVLLPLEALAKRFLRHQKATVSPEWLKNQKKHVAVFLTRCPVKDAGKVKPSHVRDFLVGLKRAPGTTNRYSSTVSGMFRWAVQGELLDANPVAKVPQRRERKRTTPFLSRREIGKVMDALEGPLLLPVALGLYAGLRRGEICALRWEDVDMEHGEIHVRRTRRASGKLAPVKDSEERTVPLKATLGLLLHRPHEGPYVAVRYRKVWRPENLSRAVAALGERLGLDKLNGPQVLRRTFASHLVAAGEPIGRVAAWLGDSIAVTEKHYARLMPGRRGKIDEAF